MQVSIPVPDKERTRSLSGVLYLRADMAALSASCQSFSDLFFLNQLMNAWRQDQLHGKAHFTARYYDGIGARHK